MAATSKVYLIIFLPLISSLFCQIFGRKILPFLVAFCCLILLLFLAVDLFPKDFSWKEIANDFAFSPFSLALEFRVDALAITFLTLFIFLKLVILFFYFPDFEKCLCDENRRNFYAVFLLNLFSVIGIFTTNNLFNLFVFFEIYAISFFAILSVSQDFELLKTSFRYFALNATSSLFILFCFFIIYLVSGEINFDRILFVLHSTSKLHPWFLAVIFFLFACAFLIKFFPFWLYLQKIKSANPITNFLSIDLLFIKTIIGLFLSLKFIYFFFENNLIFAGFNFAPLLAFIASLLVFYSSWQLFKQKHLKLIAAYSCLNNFGFILAAIALGTSKAAEAMFFYLLNFSLVNLLLFIFATFLRRNFNTSSLGKIWLIRKNNFLLLMPIKLLIPFIAGFPLTILFFANWHFATAVFSFGFESLLLLPLLFSIVAHLNLAIGFINSIFPKNPTKQQEMSFLGFKKYQFYLISFWFLIMAIYATVFLLHPLSNFAVKFANYISMS